ncbi:MAG: flagellar export chaperone FlgN [Synergistaceae bacterium]|nr:flagellar export chaperone FlgN [Synergistaceae bacterium]MBQ3399276.1 flagellar export chaperone FlgN [Synergistaceae bacterium]MBQ3760194.1 flagellar export chaperone FlgN [Synergistaceae bacterium]MBQ4402051.1 flagellar export chaperone FlgN [Synergistaceae bacterium]MBQ6002775.1 flagellar export chaperone FlgN [Synergistaceae bacterium]
MRPDVEELIDAVLDEADCIDDLIDAIREQRSAMRRRDTETVNSLMDETRNLSFEAQSQEKLRADIAARFAKSHSCEAVASSLASVMDKDEQEEFNGAVDRLTQSVFVLKSEMMILTGLIDQHEQYTSMLLSEWRRLNGDMVSQSGSADFRG